MTTVTQLITDAYRQSNLLAIGASPSTNQTTEALRYLNRAVKSVFGTEVGEALESFPIGAANYTRPVGYPWWDYTTDADWFVPSNSRVVLNISAPLSLYLHPNPDNGDRFGLLDSAGNIATYNVTVSGNGRQIEGVQSLTLNTNGANNEWFYREDLGNWVKYATLIAADTFPFPEEFDDYFITELAMRLNPSYGHAIDEQSLAVYKRAKTQLRARYRQTKRTGVDLGLVRMTKMAPDRDAFSNGTITDDENAYFNKGKPV